jgi:hypothetical protein
MALTELAFLVLRESPFILLFSFSLIALLLISVIKLYAHAFEGERGDLRMSEMCVLTVKKAKHEKH